MRGRIGDNPSYTVVNAGAQETGLPDASYDVVVGEAMLTMQTDKHKLEIMQEAARILAPGGYYGYPRAWGSLLMSWTQRSKQRFSEPWPAQSKSTPGP